jgi:hypothetical protein
VIGITVIGRCRVRKVYVEGSPGNGSHELRAVVAHHEKTAQELLVAAAGGLKLNAI